MLEVIILSDSESVELRFYQCDLQAPLSVVQRCLRSQGCFRMWIWPPYHTPPDSAVEDAQVAKASYMRAGHARQREDRIRAQEHAYASPRRLPRLAERRV